MAVITGLSFEGYRANPAIFDARLHESAPAARAGERCGTISVDPVGELSLRKPRWPKNPGRAVVRDVAPVFGALENALQAAIEERTIELNGVVSLRRWCFWTPQDMVSAPPNFHPASLALALDSLAIAVAHWASASALRVTK